MDLARLAAAFVRMRRKQYKREMAFYKKQPSYREALRAAAMCETESGVMHPHQRRVGTNRVSAAYHRLQDANLRGCQTFHEVHQEIKERVRHLDRIGDLYVYDVAQRIGAFLELKPDRVYLHAGTLAGARRLGLKPRGGILTSIDLPPALKKIEPALLEDFFCMEKRQLHRSMLKGWRPPSLTLR